MTERVGIVIVSHSPDIARGAADMVRQMVGEDAGVEGGEGAEPESEYTLTLALTPQETALLLYAREQGRVELSLRSRADKGEQVAVFPADMPLVMQSILGRQPTSPDGPMGPPQRTVEIYKGLERSVVTINE